MARIRSIKPDFFLHDGIADLQPLTRLLFIGLWTHADRAGRLSDKPRRIKAAILPYDDVDIDELLAELTINGFLQRYSVGNEAYIQVVGFVKHQQPNTKEVESRIPAPDATDACLAPCKYDADAELPRGERGSSITGKERKGAEQEQEGSGSSTAGAVPRPSRKTKRVPLDFALTDDLRTFALGLGLDAAAVAEEWEKFRDHEFQKAHSDWPAAARNWFRNAVKFRQRDGARGNGPAFRSPTAAEVTMGNVRALLAEDEGAP